MIPRLAYSFGGVMFKKSGAKKSLLATLACTGLTLCISFAWAVESYFIDPATLPAAPVLSQSLLDSLNPRGSRLYTYSNGLREPFCEIFLVKTVSAQAAPPASGRIQYGKLIPGTLIGVIHLLRETPDDYFVDFHSQKLKPGYYTMRYAVLPVGTYADGPELGDVVVLSPATKDSDPVHIPPVEELMSLGRSVSGGNQPASMQLVSFDPGNKRAAAVTENRQGIVRFQFRLRLTSNKGESSPELAVAMVVLTPAVHTLGSPADSS
jgi:hypothetical protein